MVSTVAWPGLRYFVYGEQCGWYCSPAVGGWLLEMSWRDVMQNLLVLAVVVVLSAIWRLLVDLLRL